MVGRLLVGFVCLNLLFSVLLLVDFQWDQCGPILCFLCHGWQTFSGVRVAQSLVFCVLVSRLLVGFVWLNLQNYVSLLVDFQQGSCGSIYCFLCHGWQTFSGVRVAQSLVFCVMVGRHLVGFVWLNLQLSVSWLVNFQWGSCGSIFSFLFHGWQTFSGVRVAQSLVFCVMGGRLLVGFVGLNLQFSVSWQVDFQWGSCGSIFSFLCHGRYTFSGVRVAQSLAFCVMVGKFLVGFVGLNLLFFVSWQVDFQWGSCGSIFRCLCHGRHTFSGVRVAQSFVFCVMVGRLLVGSCGSNFSFLCHVWQTFSGFVWRNLQFSVSWLVDFQWGSCGSVFSFLCRGRQTFSGVRVAQSLVFCVMVSRLLLGSCGSIFSFLCPGWQTFGGVRVAQSLVFCVMVGRLLVGFVWLNLQFSVSWLVDFQWASCGSIFRFLCHGWQTFWGGFVWLNLLFFVSWLVDFQWGSCGSIFSFLCHGWQTFSGVRVAQSLVFCVLVGRLLVGFVWLNLQISVSWQVYFQWVSCGSILCFCVMVGRLLVGFLWLNLQFSVSWQVDFQWGSCGSIFSFLCHGRQTFSGLRVSQSLVFCVIVGRLLVGFLWPNLFFSVSWLVDFQWGSCGSIFSFLCHGWQTFSGVRVAQSLCFLCHGWQTFGGVRVAQSLVFCVMVGRLLVGFLWLYLLVFCVMVGRLLVGFVWLNLQFSVSWQVDFQWASCGSIFRCLCHGRHTFSGVPVAQSFVFCVMVGRLLVGFVWLNLQFSVSWKVKFQLGSCGSIFSFLCHGRQTFRGVRVAQSLVFCVIVGRLLVGFVWLNLQLSVSWLVHFQWGSCGSIFIFLCHGRQTFSGVRVAQSLAFCVMVGKFLVGFVWLNLQFSVSWQVDFQWASCGSMFSFLCYSWQTFSGVRVAQSFVFCVMVGRLLVGFVWLNLQFSVSWLVDFQWASCGSIFRFLCHCRYTFSGVRVAQSFVFCVIVGRLLVGFLWLNLQFSVSWLVDFQWGSCGSIFSFLCHGWQTFSGLHVAQSLDFCVMVGILLVGFVWLNLLFFVSWLVDVQWGSCGSIFSFLCHDRQTFSGFVWLNLQLSVSWQVDFQWGSCGSIFSFLCHGW